MLWYVSSNNSRDTKDGRSLNTAFRRVLHAIHVAGPDDTIVVCAGIYDQDLAKRIGAARAAGVSVAVAGSEARDQCGLLVRRTRHYAIEALPTCLAYLGSFVVMERGCCVNAFCGSLQGRGITVSQEKVTRSINRLEDIMMPLLGRCPRMMARSLAHHGDALRPSRKDLREGRPPSS